MNTGQEMPPDKTKEQVVQEFRTRAIEAATVRVIAEKGLAGATMQAIAEEAGVAKGTLYLYFENRADLLQNAAEATYAEILDRLEAVFARDLQFADKIRALVQAQLEFVDSHRDFFRLYVAIRYAGSDIAEGSRLERPTMSQFQTYLRRLSELLEGALEKDRAGQPDPTKLALFMTEGINAILLHRLEEAEPPDAQAEAVWITDLLIHGMAAAEPRY